jgi:molecular chaperone GrpE
MDEMNEEKVQEIKDQEGSEEQQPKDESQTETPEVKEEIPAEHEKKSKKKRNFLGQKNEHSDEIAKLKAEVANLNDKLLRQAAEFDNYKKRTLREKTDLLRYGSEAALLNVLNVVDDFDRARKAISEASDIEAVRAGIDLIYNKFIEYMNQQGLKEIEAINLDFNTDFHEAVTRFPATSEEMKGKNIDVVQKGYMLYDKVIRFSKVVVGE